MIMMYYIYCYDINYLLFEKNLKEFLKEHNFKDDFIYMYIYIYTYVYIFYIYKRKRKTNNNTFVN